jgi:hypothetical protein
MAKETFITKRFNDATLATITNANEIIDEYQADGYELTLRQLYYQFVARDLIANKQKEYNRLGNIISDARLAGLTDWGAIVDRTRNLKGNSHWESPASIIRSAAYSYRRDKWADQDHYIEFWIEKDALIGVIADPCNRHDVNFFSCRGYVSQSEMYTAAKRHAMQIDDGKTVTVYHLGDHDPSGIDMTRDIQDRLNLLSGYPGQITVNRIALNMDQVEQYTPPPNPAKITDSRAQEYIERFGSDSWELDALEPRVLSALVDDAVESVRDVEKWDQAVDQEESEKARLEQLADDWK